MAIIGEPEYHETCDTPDKRIELVKAVLREAYRHPPDQLNSIKTSTTGRQLTDLFTTHLEVLGMLGRLDYLEQRLITASVLWRWSDRVISREYRIDLATIRQRRAEGLTKLVDMIWR